MIALANYGTTVILRHLCQLQPPMAPLPIRAAITHTTIITT